MNTEITSKIIESYRRDRAKILPLLAALRQGQKYGFSLVCVDPARASNDQVIDAARFLISLIGSWPADELPVHDREFRSAFLASLKHSDLYADATHLLGLTVGAYRKLAIA